MRESFLARLEKLDPEVIQSFRKTQISLVIPADLQEYILQISSAFEIAKHEGSVTRAAKKLCEQYPALTLPTAKKRYYDAITYFHVNNNVSNEVWDHFYADKFENLATMCLAKGKEEAAGRFIAKAHELRTKESDSINPEDLKAPVFIITDKLSPEDLGFENKNLQEIASKATQGKYAEIINALPIDKKEKDALFRDAGIEDVDYEDVSDE